MTIRASSHNLYRCNHIANLCLCHGQGEGHWIVLAVGRKKAVKIVKKGIQAPTKAIGNSASQEKQLAESLLGMESSIETAKPMKVLSMNSLFKGILNQ